MSYQASAIGTTPYTYSMYWDRTGGWANYLSALSLQNSHDRAKVAGTAESVLGQVEINEINQPVKTTNAKAGQPLPNSRVKYQKAPVKTKYGDKVTQMLKTRSPGYNPRYNAGTYGAS